MILHIIFNIMTSHNHQSSELTTTPQGFPEKWLFEICKLNGWPSGTVVYMSNPSPGDVKTGRYLGLPSQQGYPTW